MVQDDIMDAHQVELGVFLKVLCHEVLCIEHIPGRNVCGARHTLVIFQSGKPILLQYTLDGTIDGKMSSQMMVSCYQAFPKCFRHHPQRLIFTHNAYFSIKNATSHYEITNLALFVYCRYRFSLL